MKWIVVAFKHPDSRQSVVFMNAETDASMFELVRLAVRRGANLMSIRGFDY